ncbi:MAG: hypothetical protein ACYS1A_08535 [Planctomycetota bacterium]
MGAKEGEAFVYHWKWYYGISGWVLWVVLVPAFVLVKANRNRCALLILIPLLILSLLWFGLKKMLPFDTSDEVMLDQVVYWLIAGVAMLFLLGHKVGNHNQVVTFLLALVVMSIPCVIGVVSYGGFEFSQEMAASVIMFAVLTLTMLVGFILAGWQCRKCYSSSRFMLWLAVWIWVASVVFVLSYIGFLLTAVSYFALSLSKLVIIILMSSLVISVCSYVLLLPFMILAFRSSFFRERFFACLCLPLIAPTVEPDTERLSEQE